MYGERTHIRNAHEHHAPVRHEPTRVVEVFVAGPYQQACDITARFCKEVPCCVTVTPTTFIYRGGREDGVVVGFRNYPRFPTDPYTMRSMAQDLGERLRDGMAQDSYMVVDASGMTSWSTTRQGG